MSHDVVVQSGGSCVPPASYVASQGSVLHANRAFYTRVAETTARKPLEDFTVPIRSGRAWRVPAGHICRISTLEGPQVGDLNIWSLHNPREKFWASRTKQLHAAHVTTFDRLWSCLPFLRPMVTIVGDSLGGDKYGTDAVGGRVHDLLGTRCDPYVNKMLTGDDFDYHCHSNLTRAIMPWGLSEYDVHDVINIFQVTGLNRDDKYFMRPCPAKAGDYIEFFAEIDVLMALSTCPGGDLSAWSFGGGAVDMLATCRPLDVKVWEITNGDVLKDWEPFESPKYEGLHGIDLPTSEWEKITPEELR